MKKAIYILLLSVLFVTSSCLKENHSVRFKNDFNQTIQNVQIGTADIGTVNAGDVSGYKPIDTGNISISGQGQTGNLSGSGSISGKGKHKWTVTLSSAGTITMTEDK